MPEPTFLFDDAYITLTSALALGRGGDSHYPTASALHGVTSPVHTAIVAALAQVLPGPWALLGASLGGALLYVAALVAMGRRASLPAWEVAGFVASGVGAGWLLHHLVSGLETSLALAALAWSIVWLHDGRDRRVAVLCGVLPFIRPELGLWSLVVGATVLIRSRRTAISWMALAGLAALPWAVLVWSQTGTLLPTSLEAKRLWFGQDCLPWAQRADILRTSVPLWLVLSIGVAPGAAGLWRARAGRALLVFLAMTFGLWVAAAPGLLAGYQRFRYQAVLVAALAWGVCHLPPAVRRGSLLAGAAAAAFFAAQVARTEPGLLDAVDRDRRAAVTLLRAWHADRVLIHDAGYLAHADAAPLLVDMVGLKTPEAVAHHARWSGPSCGAERWRAIDAIAAGAGARFLLIWPAWDELYGVTAGLRRAGWTVEFLGQTAGDGPVALYRLGRER